MTKDGLTTSWKPGSDGAEYAIGFSDTIPLQEDGSVKVDLTLTMGQADGKDPGLESVKMTVSKLFGDKYAFRTSEYRSAEAALETFDASKVTYSDPYTLFITEGTPDKADRVQVS